MHFVLDEKIHQRDESAKKGCREILAIFHGARIGRTEIYAADSPGESRDYVQDHEDVVHVVVIGARDVRPSAACQGSEQAHDGNGLGQRVARLGREEVP